MQVYLVGVDPLIGQVPDFFLDPAFDRVTRKRERRHRIDALIHRGVRRRDGR